MSPETVTPAGELYVSRLLKPWTQPSAPVVVIEEEAGTTGWSSYRLERGVVVAVMPAIDPTWTREHALVVLVRALANLTQVCPSCAARARLGEDPAHGPALGTMEHEAVCPVGDDGLREVAARKAAPVGPLPDRPRSWTIWPPRLRPGYRPRRRFSAEPVGKRET